MAEALCAAGVLSKWKRSYLRAPRIAPAGTDLVVRYGKAWPHSAREDLISATREASERLRASRAISPASLDIQGAILGLDGHAL